MLKTVSLAVLKSAPDVSLAHARVGFIHSIGEIYISSREQR